MVACWAIRRAQRLTDWCERENRRLAPLGLQWVYRPTRKRQGAHSSEPFKNHTPLVLRWLSAVRPAYEAAHPHARQLLREGLPDAFWQPEDRQIWSTILALHPGLSPEERAERRRLFAVEIQRRQMLLARQPVAGLEQAGAGAMAAAVQPAPQRRRHLYVFPAHLTMGEPTPSAYGSDAAQQLGLLASSQQPQPPCAQPEPTDDQFSAGGHVKGRRLHPIRL